jgi:hypothetical protein
MKVTAWFCWVLGSLIALYAQPLSFKWWDFWVALTIHGPSNAASVAFQRAAVFEPNIRTLGVLLFISGWGLCILNEIRNRQNTEPLPPANPLPFVVKEQNLS